MSLSIRAYWLTSLPPHHCAGAVAGGQLPLEPARRDRAADLTQAAAVSGYDQLIHPGRKSPHC